MYNHLYNYLEKHQNSVISTETMEPLKPINGNCTEVDQNVEVVVAFKTYLLHKIKCLMF